ncbi:MAG: TonB family protein [Candidatus Synoicihabitans palmerolidicus]|nr:TonB family protein [Candidatus Synoicihabitans palmerolidicus]
MPAAELAQAPQPLSMAKSIYPVELAQRGITGRAVIDFYMDLQGNVRLPAIAAAEYPELGDMALDASRQWTFASPSHYGDQVMAHARQTFEFIPAEPLAANSRPLNQRAKTPASASPAPLPNRPSGG